MPAWLLFVLSDDAAAHRIGNLEPGPLLIVMTYVAGHSLSSHASH